jgi:hypothetical protein
MVAVLQLLLLPRCVYACECAACGVIALSWARRRCSSRGARVAKQHTTRHDTTRHDTPHTLCARRASLSATLQHYLANDQKLKRFVPLIQGSLVVPAIYDAQRTLLSLPPLINGAATAVRCCRRAYACVCVLVCACLCGWARVCVARLR